MFLLIPAYPGCPGQTAVKWLLYLPTVFQRLCICLCLLGIFFIVHVGINCGVCDAVVYTV